MERAYFEKCYYTHIYLLFSKCTLFLMTCRAENFFTRVMDSPIITKMPVIGICFRSFYSSSFLSCIQTIVSVS